ncbi:MAG: ABC transporter permease [Anaerolineales bacterium]
MRRFGLLLLNEFRMTRTALVVNLIAVLQPTLMYALMATIMVMPTFTMNVVRPAEDYGLISAMEQVGSPIGMAYIEPILLETAETGFRQVIEVEEGAGVPVAVQRYSYIDSNLVKNLRNRLTAALLVMWNRQLGSEAVTLHQHPWLPEDISYNVYFGMAMIPLAAYLAAAMIGGYLMAQEFEHGTVLEYRLSPVSFLLLLAAKITRLLLTGLLAGAVLYTALGLITGVWASAILPVFLPILPLALIAACIGLLAGLLTRSSLPAFLAALASAFGFWLLGSGFGLAAGFSDIFERVSRAIPNTPVIEMLFPYFYFGRQVAAHPAAAKVQLAVYCVVLVALVIVAYRQRVLRMEK